MYWNNCWVSPFNKSNFLNKTIFLEKLFHFFFSEKLFQFFFTSTLTNKNIFNFYKNIFTNKPIFIKRNFNLIEFAGKNLPKLKKIKYNITKLWVVKYNSYILLSLFCFFYFKIKKTKKQNIRIKKQNFFFFKISQTTFWKRRKKKIFNKSYFNIKTHLVF